LLKRLAAVRMTPGGGAYRTKYAPCAHHIIPSPVAVKMTPATKLQASVRGDTESGSDPDP
jgi:hypothetical protein